MFCWGYFFAFLVVSTYVSGAGFVEANGMPPLAVRLKPMEGKSHNPYAQSVLLTVAEQNPPEHPVQQFPLWDRILKKLDGRNRDGVIEEILTLKAEDVCQASFEAHCSLWLSPDNFLPLPLGVVITPEFQNQYDKVMERLNMLAEERGDRNEEKVSYYKILIRYADVMTDSRNFNSLSEGKQKEIHTNYFMYRLGLGNILSFMASGFQGEERAKYNREAFDVFHQTLEAALTYDERMIAGTCYLSMSRAFYHLGRADRPYHDTILDACIIRLDKSCFRGGFNKMGPYVRIIDRDKIRGKGSRH